MQLRTATRMSEAYCSLTESSLDSGPSTPLPDLMSTSVSIMLAVWSAAGDNKAFGLLTIDYALASKLLGQMELFNELRARERRLSGLVFRHSPVFVRIDPRWLQMLSAHIGDPVEYPLPNAHRAFYAAADEILRGSEHVWLEDDSALPAFADEEIDEERAELDGEEVFWRSQWLRSGQPFSTARLTKEMLLANVALRVAPGSRERADAFRKLAKCFPQAAVKTLDDDPNCLLGGLEERDLAELLHDVDAEVRVALIAAIGMHSNHSSGLAAN